jgi:bacterioferritin (cytochrome b1)
VGKAIPFVAPAFILLKVIIDLERRAQDADAKCTDLIERVTFMLSHLPALEKVEILPATRHAIDRMNEALKEAAALIAAYRKQSRVVRSSDYPIATSSTHALLVSTLVAATIF